MTTLNGFQEVSCENNTETRSKRNRKGFYRKHNIKANFEKGGSSKKTKLSEGGFCAFFQNGFWWHIVPFLCSLTLRGWQIAVLFEIPIVTPEVLCRAEGIALNAFSWTSGGCVPATNDSPIETICKQDCLPGERKGGQGVSEGLFTPLPGNDKS